MGCSLLDLPPDVLDLILVQFARNEDAKTLDALYATCRALRDAIGDRRTSQYYDYVRLMHIDAVIYAMLGYSKHRPHPVAYSRSRRNGVNMFVDENHPAVPFLIRAFGDYPTFSSYGRKGYIVSENVFDTFSIGIRDFVKEYLRIGRSYAFPVAQRPPATLKSLIVDAYAEFVKARFPDRDYLDIKWAGV